MADHTRRLFIAGLGAAAGTGILAGWSRGSSPAGETLAAESPMAMPGRMRAAYEIRARAARRLLDAPAPVHRTNGDEDRYPTRAASYSKGLPHSSLGEVHPAAYAAFLKAVRSGRSDDFEQIPMGGDRRLVNPMAGLAYERSGAEVHGVAIPPPPAFDSARAAAEIAENYWMALVRDVPFSGYATHPTVQRAVADLSRFSGFHGPTIDGELTPQSLFRSDIAGSLIGPYVSQFLYLEARLGAEYLPRQMRTVRPDADYLLTFKDWLTVQNGTTPWPDQYDPTHRYMRTARDLGQWVHYDLLFQAYLEALLVLFRIGARRQPTDPYQISKNQVGSSTFGSNHISSLVCEVARPAARAAWFEKWFVHRSLRPEAYAGRVHNHLTGRAQYPVHRDILESDVVKAVFSKQGTYLLAQAFPEGSPQHPSYPAGHATVAGACTTVVKAFFDDGFVIHNAKQPSADGLTLDPYEGPPLTVGGELDKLACNIAYGRNMAGVHWRSDAEASLRLGEEVAIQFLREDRECLPEPFPGYTLRKFDGTRITI